MKKVLYSLIAIVLLTGCSCTANMGNTPTKKVEEYLNKYQTNDDDVVSDLDDVLTNDTTLTADERTNYSDFMKKHYQDMQYEIKDEMIDGDTATVDAEITVRSYADVVNEANQYRIDNPDEFTDTNTFAGYRLDRLKEVTDTETYTITFHLTKENDEWKVENLSDDDLKILVKLLNFSVTTTTESENISSRRVSKNGISGKGNRNVYKLDEVASYHAIDESIPYDAKEYPGWNASKLEGFCLFGREEKVIKYSQLMVRVLDILYLKNPEKFREIVRNPEEHELASLFCNIKKPQKLPSVDIEVESYSSSQVKVTQLCKMMKAMKFEPGELKLKVRLAN